MKITVNDAIDFGEIVWVWAETHPEMKKDFRLTHEYDPSMRAFRVTMERTFADETKHGLVRLLEEDILENMTCPSDYIYAVLEEMYKELMGDDEYLEKKLRYYVEAWIYVYADPHDHIRVEVKPVESFGYMVTLFKDCGDRTISKVTYVSKTACEESWGEMATDLYKCLKEKEKKEMGYFAGTENARCTSKEDNDVRLKMAKAAVVAWYNEHNAPAKITMDDVYIVWFCKVLRNWKALAGTHNSDGMYYEITFDGNYDLVYFDAYKKWQNVQMNGRELKERAGR